VADSGDDRSTGEGERFARLTRGVRIDLVIAVCALLVSSLATAASWWQTRVIQQQLSAQVWPYMNVSETVSPDSFKILFNNDGLGPAVLRSVLVEVDGKPVGGFVGLLHAVLGTHLRSRAKNGEIALDLSTLSPGSVLRAGETVQVFSLTSKHYAPLLFDALKRIKFQTCYCAIVPGSCWLADSSAGGDPRPLPVCPPVERDLLRSDDTTQSRVI